jgi:uncharacterized protein YndB with AHSA1/START domain
MTVQPTGRREDRDGTDVLVLDRTLQLPPRELWAAVTEPERLARWIATWSGDPASGSVAVRMTAEGDDVSESTYEVLACEPPRRLAVRSVNPWGVWELELVVSAAGAGSTLSFAQVVHDAAALGDIGPGWEYYLDRLVAAETGGDPDAIDFADYHPVLVEHYAALPAPGVAG